MAYSGNINIGSAPDDFTGEALRTACVKINGNFQDLFNLQTNGITPIAGTQNRVWATGNATDAQASFRALVKADLPITTAYTDTSNTFTVGQAINGSSNITQLAVRGHSTQTDPIFLVENSAGTDLFTVANNGNVVVTGSITTTGTVNGRNIATDGTKLDTIETGADVTDSVNVKSSIEGMSLTNVSALNANDRFLYLDNTSGLLETAALQHMLFSSTGFSAPPSVTFDTSVDRLLMYDVSGSRLGAVGNPTALASPILSNSGLTTVSPSTSDLILIQDASDSNNLKRVTVSNVNALVNAGAVNYSAQTGNYTILSSNSIIELTSGAVANATFTLPAVSGNTGLTLRIINSSSFNLTVDGNSTELINFSETIQVAPSGSLRLVCNGTKWLILGDRVLINNQTFSGVTSITVNNMSTATFANYEVLLDSQVSNLFAVQSIRYSSDNGSTFNNAGVYHCVFSIFSTSSALYLGGTTNTAFQLTGGTGNLTGDGVSAIIHLHNLGQSYSRITGHIAFSDGGAGSATFQEVMSGRYIVTAANAFQVFPSAGTFSGRIRVYGLL